MTKRCSSRSYVKKPGTRRKDSWILKRCYTISSVAKATRRSSLSKQYYFFTDPLINDHGSALNIEVLFFFLRAKIKCERHRMSLLGGNKSCHVGAWRHLSFQSWTALRRCRASSAPGTGALSFPILLGGPWVLQTTHRASASYLLGC